MNNNFFDKQVREKMEGHEAPVPPGAWANIQKGKKKKRPVPLFLLLPGLLLCTTLAVYLYNYRSADNKTTGSSIVTEVSKKYSGANKEDQGEGNQKNTSVIKEKNNDLVFSEKNIPAKDPADRLATSPAFNQQTSGPGEKSIDEIIKSQPSGKTKHDTQDQPLNTFSSSKKMNNGFHDTDFISAGRKKKKSTGSASRIHVATPGLAEDTVTGIVHLDEVMIANVDLPATPENEKSLPENATAVITSPAADTFLPLKNHAKKKKNNRSFDIDISFSGFVTVAKRVNISGIRRTMEEPMHRAEFNGKEVSIRLQPSAGFNVLLYKSFSSKLSVGAGLSYQGMKEYIHLSGEEINTRYTLVKRLDGNMLRDDTVTSVTKGTRTINAVNSYSFWSIPVALRYNLLQRNTWAVELQAGIDFNLQSKYKNSVGGELVPQFAAINTMKRNSSIGTGYNAGLRVSRSVGKNWWIYATPYLQVSPKRLYLERMPAPATIHKTGITLGITYGWK